MLKTGPPRCQGAAPEAAPLSGAGLPPSCPSPWSLHPTPRGTVPVEEHPGARFPPQSPSTQHCGTGEGKPPATFLGPMPRARPLSTRQAGWGGVFLSLTPDLFASGFPLWGLTPVQGGVDDPGALPFLTRWALTPGTTAMCPGIQFGPSFSSLNRERVCLWSPRLVGRRARTSLRPTLPVSSVNRW